MADEPIVGGDSQFGLSSAALHAAVRALPQSLNNGDYDAIADESSEPAAKRAKTREQQARPRGERVVGGRSAPRDLRSLPPPGSLPSKEKAVEEVGAACAASAATPLASARKRMCVRPTAQVKRVGAEHAVDTFISSGMVVGVGTGETAQHALERLSQRLRSGALERVSVVQLG